MTVSPVNLTTLPGILGLPAGTTATTSGDLTMLGLSNTSLAGFSVTETDQFLVLSTGLAGNVTDANDSGSQGTDIGIGGLPGDTITLTFTIPVPVGAQSLAFNFSFLSEEYPEFVGTNFNDFFSVTLDGLQVAFDTNGNLITVNNNFFDAGQSTAGTMFDGSTPPLQASAPITEGAESIVLAITVSDVGDGIYDSAGFIGDFAFGQPQIVFVQFGPGTVEFPAPFYDDDISGSFSLPGSGLTAAQQAQILAEVNAIYDAYQIEFVGEEPMSGEYSTIHIGGVTTDLPTWLQPNIPNFVLFGQAEQIDYGNEDMSDEAFVLSGEIGSNASLIAQVLAHEAGHILGLRHVEDSGQLMYPFADATATTIGGTANLAEIIDGIVTPVGATQNSHEELVRNLGLEDGSQLVEQDGYFESFLNYYNFNFTPNPTLSTNGQSFYDIRVVVANAEGEIIQVIELGDLVDGSGLDFQLPTLASDTIVLIAKTDPDGDYNAILTPEGVENVDFDTLGISGILAVAGIAAGDLEGGNLVFNTILQGGQLNAISQVSVDVVPISDNLATEGPDLLDGTDEPEAIIALGGNDTVNAEGGNDTVFGNDGNDIIAGGLGDDNLNGGGDNDILNGNEDNDILFGGDGNDRLDGGTGDDTMNGGLGNDRYIVDSAGDVITGEIGFSLGGGIDTVESWVSYTLTSGLEILRLQGTANINGTGGFAPEALVGNVGNNVLDGGGGNDVLNGKDGDDTLTGGLGADSLVGEAGADVFDFNNINESRPGQASRDFINGFVRGEDLIDLSEIDANSLTGANDAFDFIGNAAFSGTAGELRYFTFSGGNFNIVEADVNGDGIADMQIFVNLTNFMTGTDFVL